VEYPLPTGKNKPFCFFNWESFKGSEKKLENISHSLRILCLGRFGNKGKRKRSF
jgi:hypothetical protein